MEPQPQMVLPTELFGKDCRGFRSGSDEGKTESRKSRRTPKPCSDVCSLLQMHRHCGLTTCRQQITFMLQQQHQK